LFGLLDYYIIYLVKFIKIKFFLILISILGIMVIPNSILAETQIEVLEGDIMAESVPNNPQPYQDATINISSYATDLNKAIITWQVGSTTVLSGIGKTSYSLKTGASDTPIIVNINIKTIGSMNSINKKITIIPSEVEIMWESTDGYIPPFYKGKILPISGSTIKVVAIPNSSTIKNGSGSISYTWKKGYDVLPDVSGYNKNYYIFKNSMFDEKNEITVMATSVAGNYAAEKTIEIPIFKPSIVFYKKSPTEGILYNSALNIETFMTEDEMTVIAEPYFFSLTGNENNFSYNWKINNETIETPSKKTELTIRPTARGGYATINFVIGNLNEKIYFLHFNNLNFY
jgi:hypothetical protein